METTLQLNNDRVRRNTGPKINEKIDQKTEDNIQRFSRQGAAGIQERLWQLEKEWDIERALELTSGLNMLIGLTLAVTVNKKWALLSAISGAFLAQHALQGWCPPLPLLRYFGVRTRDEIQREKDALRSELDDLMIGERMYQGGY